MRHGSIMALREILTNHGACAGVLSLNCNLEKFWFCDSEDIKCEEPTSDSLEIDLNAHFAVDENEPAPKRHKSGNELSSPENKLCSLVSIDGETKHSTSTGTVAGLNANPTLDNGAIVGTHVKVEMEPSPDRLNYHCKVEDAASIGSSFEDNCSISNLDLITRLPKTSRFMKLIKLTRFSWMKNWEFLQDCAIRFLCILSLDR